MSGHISALTTQDVQCGYIRGEIRDGHGVDHDHLSPQVEAEFNTWLIGVRAEVWDEAYRAGAEAEATECTDYINGPHNPYRKGAN